MKGSPTTGASATRRALARKPSATQRGLRADLPLPHRGPVLVDSGPLIANFNASDHWCARVRDWLQHNPQADLLSTWPVATEVCAMLARRVSQDMALNFLRWVQRGGLRMDTPAEYSLAEILSISERYANVPLDLADASIAEAASRLKIRHVLTIDSDFDIYQDRARRRLTNLLII